MTEKALYGELAGYYDRVYQWKDYDEDIRRLMGILEEEGRGEGGRLLDIGCGTGGHLVRLVDRFECTGVDVSGEMLEVARVKLPAVHLVEADMATFRLGERFDVVISMFGTIGYALTTDEVRRVFDNIARHLAEGGVAVVEPFISRSDHKPGHVSMTIYEDDDVKISRVSSGRLDGDLFLFEMHYLIGERGKGVRHLVDTHTTRLHEPEELLGAMEAAGLEARFDPEGFGQRRGALIGTRTQR